MQIRKQPARAVAITVDLGPFCSPQAGKVRLSLCDFSDALSCSSSYVEGHSMPKATIKREMAALA